jgi:uncharacterized protein (DUF1501 family)
MKRRKFIRTGALFTAPLILKGIPVSASSILDNEMLSTMGKAAMACGKILVIVQQNGGNDGLNTIFPIDQWGNLSNARSNILMNQNATLPLSGNATTAMHPSMTEMRNMYNNGKIMLVQGVSYPNPSYSHFRATDIWFTGSDANQYLDTGWLGRALDTIYPNFPTGYPNATMPDPLAIQIGNTLPFSLQGPVMNMGYCTPDPSSLLNVINAVTDPAPNNDYGLELTFLRMMKDQSNSYTTAIQNAYNTTFTQTTYPSNNLLADQLKIVAKLIYGGLQTPIYIVNHPKTHDTHENQVDAADKTLGTHADNLKILSQAINAFQIDLQNMGKANKVTGMTFSEFGRRIKSNSSLGTDHGAGAPVIFFGAALNTNAASVAGTAYPVPGMIGSSPVIPATVTVNDQVPMQFDFRQIYTTIMQDWLCMSETDANAVLGGAYTKLPIFNNTLNSITDFDTKDNNFVSVYPNPIENQNINIGFAQAINASLLVSIFTINGSKLYDGTFTINDNKLSFVASNLKASGVYILRVTYNNNVFNKKIMVK